MKLSEKSIRIKKNLLETLTGRTTAIKNNKCINPPYGCGKEIKKFKDQLSQKEYTISGLCQDCQDKFFD